MKSLRLKPTHDTSVHRTAYVHGRILMASPTGTVFFNDKRGRPPKIEEETEEAFPDEQVKWTPFTPYTRATDGEVMISMQPDGRKTTRAVRVIDIVAAAYYPEISVPDYDRKYMAVRKPGTEEDCSLESFEVLLNPCFANQPLPVDFPLLKKENELVYRTVGTHPPLFLPVDEETGTTLGPAYRFKSKASIAATVHLARKGKTLPEGKFTRKDNMIFEAVRDVCGESPKEPEPELDSVLEA